MTMLFIRNFLYQPLINIKKNQELSKPYKRKKASSFLEAFCSSGEQDRTADLRVMNPAL